MPILKWLKLSKNYTGDVIQEVAYFAALALMPIWLGLLLQYLTKQPPFEYLNNYLYTGEVLLICSSSVGPLLYVIQKEYSKNTEGFGRSFPLKAWLLLVIIIICIVSAAVIGLREGDFGEDYLSENAIWYVSAIITSFSIATFLIVNFIRRVIDDAAPDLMRDDTANYVNRFNE